MYKKNLDWCQLKWAQDVSMTMRYAHLSQEHKKKAVNLLNGLNSHQKKSKSRSANLLFLLIFYGRDERI